MRIFLIAISLIAASAVLCHSEDQAIKALDDARSFTQKGEYEKALERHIWFHDNALNIQPSLAGVRLSFALAEWVELGKKYPKAMEALKNIRDKKTSRLLAGEYVRNLFYDVKAINGYIGDSKATVQLFEQLDNANPQFATTIYDIALEDLVKSEKYDLAKKYMGNPKERLIDAISLYQNGLSYVKEKNRDDSSRTAFESIFTDKVIRIIKVLDNTGDNAEAQKIRDEALAILDNQKIRDSLPQKNIEQLN